MLELSSLGAKVMQSSAVQTAMMYDIPLEVKSTFTERKGTKIFNQENIDYTKSVTGVAYSKDDAKITITRVEDKPGVAANIFEPLNKAQINVDMVIQNISSDQKTTDITFTVKRDDIIKTKQILKDNTKINYKEIISNDKVAKVSIVGAGIIATPLCSIYLLIFSILIFIILELACSPLVKIGICQFNQDFALILSFMSAPDRSAQVTCSPDDKRTSNSLLSNSSEILFERSISSLVFPAIAETITIILFPAECSFSIILATLIFFSEASIPVTFAPSLAIGSLISPPPQPISNIFKPCKKLFLLFSNL